MSNAKKVFLVVGVAVVAFFGVFVWNVARYYHDIRAGKPDPFLAQAQQASFSHFAANATVTPADLLHVSSASSPMMGTSTAPVKIVEFLDFDCPYSHDAFSAIRAFAAAHANQVSYAVRYFPLTDIHPRALSAALAATCADEQGKFWLYHDQLFLHPANHEDADLMQYAANIGLDQTAFSSCYTSQKYLSKIQTDVQDGLRVGVEGTPTFFFNGVKVQGALDEKTLDYLTKQFLAR